MDEVFGLLLKAQYSLKDKLLWWMRLTERETRNFSTGMAA